MKAPQCQLQRKCEEDFVTAVTSDMMKVTEFQIHVYTSVQSILMHKFYKHIFHVLLKIC